VGLKLWPRWRASVSVKWLVGQAEGPREVEREVVVVVAVRFVVVVQLSVVRLWDSARRREVERLLRKDWADWRDLAS